MRESRWTRQEAEAVRIKVELRGRLRGGVGERRNFRTKMEAREVRLSRGMGPSQVKT